ncbi:hypothetical protein PLESTM_001487100 [Pleodorina starrii]|nr:hypothetical protein PLESTM_001487100 [Pleodorina starrii]
MALPAALFAQQHRQDLDGESDQRDILSAAAAFFKWRQAALKANFRRELEGILEEVAQEEEATGRVQKQLQRTQERLEETSQALSKATNDYRLAQVHIDQLRTQNDELFRTLEAAEGASRVHAEQARAASIMHQEEMTRRQEESRQSKLETDGLREQYQAAVAQQQALLEALAQRDREVAEASQERLHHKRNADRLQEEVERLEAIARATGERAAAAEAQAAARSESITQLYSELSGLRERYHLELSELKAARIGAAEAQRMQERLDSVQATNDSLVAARDELRASLEGVMAKLTAAEQRLKRQAVAATMRDSLIDTIAHVSRELVRDGDESLILQATTRLSSELDLALTSNTDLAERLTSAEAVISQQQGHIRRIAEEAASLDSQLREAREQREAQHRLNAELAAELRRLAAEAALGPIMVLDAAGNLIPQEQPPPQPPSATAPATSQLEAQSTAVRVILADKGFGLGALCSAIAAAPGSIQSVRAQLAECRALADALNGDVAEVGTLLAVRPFEAEELARKLPVLQDRLAKTETCLLAAREDLTNKQVHAVSLEARVLAAESAMRGGASLLQGWSGILTQVVAAEDGRLEPDVRLGLREELKTREEALHRSLLDLAATAPPLLGGDPGYAAAQVVVREASNAMMDLALTLGDRLVDAPATRTRVLSTEQLLMDRATHLARFREVLAQAPGEIADMVERITAIVPDVQAMGPAVEEMLRCIKHFLAAGREPTVDVVALQGEVLMLRGLVRTKDVHIQALEAVGSGLRTGSPTRRAQKMVPLEALHAAERVRDGLSGEKAALQSRLVDQRVLLVAARHRLVNFMADLRRACETATVFQQWRAAAAASRADRFHTDMVAAQKEQARVEREVAEERARMEAEVAALKSSHAEEVAALSTSHAAEVASLTTSHATQVAAMQTAHAEEVRQIHTRALQAAQTRVEALRRILKDKAGRYRECLATAVLYLWRFRVRRQAEARQRWRGFSDRLRLLEEPANPTYREIMMGPRSTIASRLALRHADPSDLAVPQALTGRQIARMVLQAWRGYTQTKRKAQQVDALTEAVPAFMENLGDRRRLERAWLGLRLWTAGAATRRAHAAISDYEAATAEAQAAKVVAEAARATADVAAAEAEEERQRMALLGTDAGTSLHALASTQAGGFGSMGTGLGPGGGSGGFASVGSGPDGPSRGAGGPGYVLVPGQAPDNPYMLYQLPTVEVGTQYLPHSNTVMSSGMQAPEHGAVADVVAAARAAGLEVATQPLTSSQHQPGAVVSGPPPPPGNMVTFSALPGGGGTMPPVAGPSQAAINAMSRRRSAGGPSSQAATAGAMFATVSGGGGAGRLSRATSTRATARGRSSPGRHSRALGAAPDSRTGSRTGRPSGPVSAAVASLAERAERLMRAVDAISAGVADTAAILSPRRKVLQVEGADAEEPGTAAATAAALAEDSSAGRVDVEALDSTDIEFDRPPPPSSPSRRLQVDGTTTVQYEPQVLRGGSGCSPPWSPARGSPGAITAPLDAGATIPRDPLTSGAEDAAVTGAAASWRSPARSGRARSLRLSLGAGASGGGKAQNSIQVLLSRMPGRRQPRDESRSYGYVGSRLHEETLSTLAKKKKAGATTKGRTRTGLAPEATPLGYTALRTSPAPPPPAVVTSAWPHVPANTLPGTSSAAAAAIASAGAVSVSGGPNTSDLLRRRSDGPAEPAVHLGPTIEIPASAAAAPVRSQAPVVALPVSIAPPPNKPGRVVRFERMTPGPQPGPIEVTANRALAWGPPAMEEGQSQGLVTYIQLPSPVKVSIRMPGS